LIHSIPKLGKGKCLEANKREMAWIRQYEMNGKCPFATKLAEKER
jgi:hypothetical protein